MQRVTLVLLILAIISFSCGENREDDNPVNSGGDNSELGNSGAPDGKDAKMTDLDKSMAAMDSNYLVPSPGEVLGALNKLEDIEWSKIMDYNEQTNYSDKSARALNLGVRIAASFVAINSEDRDNFGKMSSAIFELGDALNVGTILTDKRDDLESLAAKGEWAKMAASIDDIHNDIEASISDAGEDDLVVLASIGGWLEGLRVVSAHLANNYSKDKAELLNQLDLIKYYQTKMSSISEDSKLVNDVKASLNAIVAILTKTKDGTALSENEVKQLNTTIQGIVDTIKKA